VTDDLAAQFAQMQQFVSNVHDLMTAAADRAPWRSEGADKSGAVRVTLGSDGLPTSFRIENDWTSKIDPAAFGGAVLQAFEVAVSDRMRTWTRSLTEDRWLDRADQLSGPESVHKARIPAVSRNPVQVVNPRSLGEIAEDVFTAFDDVHALAKAPKPVGASGTDQSGKLTIGLSPTALTSCVVDERWVAEQSGAQLMSALAHALNSAKENLARESAKPPVVSTLDGLLAEAMALLNDPRRLAE
jgi:hypothetical protein